VQVFTGERERLQLEDVPKGECSGSRDDTAADKSLNTRRRSPKTIGRNPRRCSPVTTMPWKFASL
jgi:hypothetical protein